MINPWCHESNGIIVSLSSGVVASAEVQMDLERAYTIGEKQTTEDFIEKRLVAKSKEFFCQLKVTSSRHWYINQDKIFLIIEEAESGQSNICPIGYCC